MSITKLIDGTVLDSDIPKLILRDGLLYPQNPSDKLDSGIRQIITSDGYYIGYTFLPVMLTESKPDAVYYDESLELSDA